jgi:hypothetical protein
VMRMALDRVGMRVLRGECGRSCANEAAGSSTIQSSIDCAWAAVAASGLIFVGRASDLSLEISWQGL